MNPSLLCRRVPPLQMIAVSLRGRPLPAYRSPCCGSKNSRPAKKQKPPRCSSRSGAAVKKKLWSKGKIEQLQLAARKNWRPYRKHPTKERSLDTRLALLGKSEDDFGRSCLLTTLLPCQS